MKLNLIVISLLVAFNLEGQCPEFSNTITLTSQSLVDAFVADYPNCENLKNTLIIGHFGAPVSTDINDLSGLSTLKRIDGELRVRNVDLLESFVGLHNIEYVGDDLVLGDNELLKSLSDFKHIDSIGGNFDIYNNPSLEVLFEEDSIVFVGSSLNITNNNKLIKISGFKELRSIEDNLEITGNSALSSTKGFDNLEVINGTLDIFDSPTLTDLIGFVKLNTIRDGMEIRGTGLTDLTGLNELQIINGSLLGNSVYITDNPSLISLDGLENLDTIQRSLFLTGNQQLESIGALSNLKSIGGKLSIHNSSISEITPLNGIEPIASTVEFRENPNLTTIDELPLAGKINGSLVIRENSSLINISAVSTIDTLLGQLNIQDNTTLSDCSSLCPLLTTGYVESIITIRDNLGNCQTEEDLTLVCTSSNQDVKELELFLLFPNPSESIVKIRAQSSIEKAFVYRADGSTVNIFEYDSGVSQINLDVSDFKAGLYLIELVTGEKRVVKRFLKL